MCPVASALRYIPYFFSVFKCGIIELHPNHKSTTIDVTYILVISVHCCRTCVDPPSIITWLRSGMREGYQFAWSESIKKDFGLNRVQPSPPR